MINHLHCILLTGFTNDYDSYCACIKEDALERVEFINLSTDLYLAMSAYKAPCPYLSYLQFIDRNKCEQPIVVTPENTFVFEQKSCCGGGQVK